MKDRVRKLRDKADAATSEAQARWGDLNTAREALAAVEAGDTAITDTPEFVAAQAAREAYDVAADAASAAEREYRAVLEIMGAEAPDRPLAGSFETPAPTGSIGEQFTGSDVFKDVAARIPDTPGSKAKVGTTDSVAVANRDQARAIMRGANASIFSTPDDIVAPDQKPGIKPLPLLPPLTVLDLITIGSTDSTSVKWVREKAFTNNAAEVAESVEGSEVEKAESALELEAVSFDVTTLAHWIPASKQSLRDVSGVRTLIDSKLEWGLRRRLARQVINGNGEGANLLGICNTEGIGHVDRSGSDADSFMEDVYDGVVSIGDSYGETPNVCFVDRTTYKMMRFAREDGDTGPFIFGHPSKSNPIEIEGCLLLPNWDLPTGMSVMGVWREFAVWMHEGISIALSDSHADFFVKNLVAILAEFSAAAGAMETVAFCEISPAAY